MPEESDQSASQSSSGGYLDDLFSVNGDTQGRDKSEEIQKFVESKFDEISKQLLEKVHSILDVQRGLLIGGIHSIRRTDVNSDDNTDSHWSFGAADWLISGGICQSGGCQERMSEIASLMNECVRVRLDKMSKSH